MAQEKPGQTLQATALVHEAYLRLVGADEARQWDSRGHFFAAAAEAMRRILVDNARRKQAEKHGGQRERLDLDAVDIAAQAPSDDLLALDEALAKLEAEDPTKAQVVKLRYFAGLSEEEAARALGISRATAHRHWHYAKVWLFRELRGTEARARSFQKFQDPVKLQPTSFLALNYREQSRDERIIKMNQVALEIDEIFFAALEIEDQTARSAYLDEICGRMPTCGNASKNSSP